MKSRFKVFSLISIVLLMFGVSGTVLADNATDIDVEISYPCGASPCDADVAVSDAVAGDVVNIYITLQDANGNPATAGPAGEALSAVTANVSTNLGLTSSLNANQFVSDAVQVNFNSPTGVEAAARANVSYTGSSPGTDIITVVVPASPDPIVGIAEVNVVASDATALAIRTYRNGAPSSVIYTVIDPQQQNGGLATENAGTAVPFWVIASDGANNYTYAPNLEGLQVTVEAYANYNGDGGVGGPPDVPGFESTSIGTATATFTNGIAQGTVVVNSGSPAGFLVLLTASVEVSATSTIGTTQMSALGIALADATVDVVPMLSGSAAKIVVGSAGAPPAFGDPYGNGALIIPAATCFSVLDDDAGLGGTPTNIMIILVDSLGNSVLSSGLTVVDGTLGTGSALDTHPLVDGSGLPPAAGSGFWDIAPGSYIAFNPGTHLADASGAPNDALSVVKGTLTFTSAGLTGDQAGVSLVPSNGAGTLDLQLVTDADGLAPVSLAAGTPVQLTLSAPSGGTILPIVNGDTLEITALEGANAQLLSTVAGGFPSKSTTLVVTAVDEVADDPLVPATLGMQISIVIYGPCTPSATNPMEPVVVTVTDISQCGISADNSLTVIDDIDPKAATLLDVTGVDGQTADDLDADPVVITSDLIADGVFVNDLLDQTAPGVNELQELDEYGNVVNPAPVFTATSALGIPTAVPAGPSPILSLVYPTSAVGQVDTITCSTLGGLSRDFEIGSLVDGSAGPSGVATDLLVLQEGPQDIDGMLINPQPGGEAIIRISADGTGTFNRNVQISFGEDSAEGAELRTLTGAALATPYTATLNMVPSLSDVRLVVSAEGCVTIDVTDLSGTPLNPASEELCFGPDVDCTVTVASASVLAGGTVQLSASTVCDGVDTPGTYTWAISTQGCTGSSVSASGLYTAPASGVCTDEVEATDTDNGNAVGTGTVAVTDTPPSVSISPTSATLLEGDTQTFTASTADQLATPVYSWEVTGGTLDTNSGDSVVFTAGLAGSGSVTVTDSANNNESATAEITIDPLVTSEIEVSPDPMLRSRWVFLPGIITIQGTDTNFGFLSRVTVEPAFSVLVVPFTKLVLGPEFIMQPVIVWPNWLAGFPGDGQTVTFTVSKPTGEGLSDDVTINLLPFILDE